MNKLDKVVTNGVEGGRIGIEDPMSLFRPYDRHGGQVRLPTADLGDSLSSDQTGSLYLQLSGQSPLLPLTRPERLSRALELGDVANKTGKYRRRRRCNRGDRQLDRKFCTVGANRFEFEPLAEDRAFARSQVAGKASTMGVPQTGRNDQFHHVHSQHLVTRESERCLRGRVEFKDPALVVHGDDAVQRRFQDRALEGFTSAKFFTLAFLCRDIRVRDHGAARNALGQRRCRHQEPALFRWRMAGILDRKPLCHAVQHRTNTNGRLASP